MIDDAAELWEWCRACFAGWKFLFSATYRRKKIEEWKQATKLRITWEIFTGVVAVSASAALIYLLFSSILNEV